MSVDKDFLAKPSAGEVPIISFERASQIDVVAPPNPKALRPLAKFMRASIDTPDAEKGDTHLKEWVSCQAQWAASLMVELAKGTEASPYDKLNPAVLNSCSALAFVNATKAGALLSLASGYGFVIKKLSQDQYGNNTWGQPLMFTVSQAGFGLTAGYQHSQSVIAVLATGALDVFKNGTTSMGSDLGLFSTDGAITGMSGGAAMGGSQHMGMTVDNSRSAFCYSKVDGVYLELSMHGSSVAPDKEANVKLYGAGYNPDAVLDTTGPHTQDLMPLLRVINQLGHQAARG